MKKYYLLILTLALSTGALFAQSSSSPDEGDYQTLDVESAYAWVNIDNWQYYDGSGWIAAEDVPGDPGIPGVDFEITTNAFIRKTTYLYATNAWIGVGGKVIIESGSGVSVDLHIGLSAYGVERTLHVKGELIIQATYTQLEVEEGSTVKIYSGGMLTDYGTNITTFNTEGIVILSSTSGGINGSIKTEQGGITGTYSQYITSGAWHFISTPFGDTQAGDFIPSTGEAYLKPYLSPGGGWGSYIYVETDNIVVGKGYELWQTDDFDFNQTGTFNQGTIELDVSSGGSISPGWNLVGNPYPCGIDWSTVADRVHVEGSAYFVYDAALDSYVSNTGDYSTGLTGTSIIPPFQGFFVEYLDQTNIEVSDVNKAHPDANLYKKANAESFTNHIKLEASLNNLTSRAVIVQQDNATNANDPSLDASVLFRGLNNSFDLFSFAGEKPSSINIYGEYPYVAELGFNVPSGGGSITLKPTDLRNLDSNLLVYLEDNVTGDYFNFLENPSYTFTANEGDITDRIRLIFNNNVGIDDLENGNINIFSNKNAIYLHFNNYQFNGKLKVYNILGQGVFETNISDHLYSPTYLNQPSGYYLVELITENKSITQKVFIQQ
jgi:hypothetical protein